MSPQDMAYLRWSKTSPEERKAIAKRMNRKRNRYMPAAQRRAIARAGGIARAAQRKFRQSLLKTGKADQMTTVNQQLGYCVKCGQKYEPTIYPNGEHDCQSGSRTGWHVKKFERTPRITSQVKLIGFQVVDHEGTVICEAYPEPWPVAVSEENFRLLAAAPDLLEACRMAQRWFDDMGPVLGESDGSHRERMLRMALQDAIAKAQPG